MKHKFTHRCTRRSLPHFRPAPAGAGSGGGPIDVGEMDIQAEGGLTDSYDGSYAIHANRIELVSRPPLPPAEPDDFVISLFSGGMGMDGLVQIGASQGVRLTAGPPEMPPASSASTNGVEIIVGEEEDIILQRGLVPDGDQIITMEPELITIDGGLGPVIIKSLTEVTLQVADGLASITLTPEGITIQGLLVMIN